MYCIKCGKEFPDGASYCPYCGDTSLTTSNNHNSSDPLANYHPTQPTAEQLQPAKQPTLFFVLSIVGMVFSMLTSLLLSRVPNVACILAVTGLVCSVVAFAFLLKYKKSNKLRGIALAGFIISIVGMASNASLIVTWIIVKIAIDSYTRSTMEYLEQYMY